MISLSFAFEMHLSPLLTYSYVVWMRPQWMLRTENDPLPTLFAFLSIFYSVHFYLTQKHLQNCLQTSRQPIMAPTKEELACV